MDTREEGAVSDARKRAGILGISHNKPNLARKKGETKMRMRFLTIAVALASVFAAQQAVAKSSSKTSATSKKKHHKKHMKKTAATSAAARTDKTA
jgi:hypothetical protein